MYRTIPQTTVMEDTQKLTHLTALEAEELQLLEDFFSGSNWDSQKQLRWNKMQSEVFGFLEVDRAA